MKATERTRIDRAWKEYRRTRSARARDALVLRYLPIVRWVARRIAGRLPEHVDRDDLVEAGMLGLLAALDAYDPAHEVKFETYCGLRVKGAILDALRADDWVPRLVRAQRQRLDRAVASLEQTLGREPSDGEVAGELGISVADLGRLVRESRAVTVVSLDEALPGDDGEAGRPCKLEALHDQREEAPPVRAERQDWLDFVLGGLSPRDRQVLMLYFVEELTMREIGLVLDISESRVCQLLKRTTRRLRERGEAFVEG